MCGTSICQIASKDRNEKQEGQEFDVNGSLPRNGSDFLRNDQNKSDLFGFLGREFINSFSDAIEVTNLPVEVSAFDASCTFVAHEKIPLHMEEADGRIVWHAKDMDKQRATHILVRSSDTDVLVLLISYYDFFKDEGLQELWMLTYHSDQGCSTCDDFQAEKNILKLKLFLFLMVMKNLKTISTSKAGN